MLNKTCSMSNGESMLSKQHNIWWSQKSIFVFHPEMYGLMLYQVKWRCHRNHRGLLSSLCASLCSGNMAYILSHLTTHKQLLHAGLLSGPVAICPSILSPVSSKRIHQIWPQWCLLIFIHPAVKMVNFEHIEQNIHFYKCNQTNTNVHMSTGAHAGQKKIPDALKME